MSSIAVFTNQGSTTLGFVGPSVLYDESRCALFSRQWKCMNCGEVRFVEGASLTPPTRPCRWCLNDGADWVSVEVDFKDKSPAPGCCSNPVQNAPIKVKPGLGPRGPQKALLIGLNYLKEGADLMLKGSHNNVLMMRRFLAFQGWPIEPMYMRVLLDDENTKKLPTRDLILESIEWLMRDADAGSNLFLHWCGHGFPEDGALLTADCDVILEDEIWELIAAKLPRGSRLTAIFDCTRPMVVIPTPKTYVFKRGGLQSHTVKPWAKELEFPADVVVIGAAPTLEKFQPHPDGAVTGVVTHALMATFLEAGAQIPWSALVAGMERNFLNRGYRGMAAQVGCLDPRDFDPAAPVNFTADHAALRPLTTEQRNVLLDSMPALPEDDAEAYTGESAGAQGHGATTCHPGCRSKHCCQVYQQYDAVRSPIKRLVVPRAPARSRAEAAKQA